MNKILERLKFQQKGQTLLELVVGLSLIAVVVGAIAIITTNGLRNTTFSKNQSKATQLAQQNLEKARTVKSSNYGVCLENQTTCSTWEEIWNTSFGTYQSGCTTGCTFVIKNNCTVTGNIVKPVCLSFAAAPADLGDNFTGQIIIEDEPGSTTTQKRVISKISWTDTTGTHSSDLVTILSKI